MAAKRSADGAPILIKKYANRRLYNTATSSYVTLDYLCQMVKEGTKFVVQDAKTKDDITRSVLTQIIVEEESKGETMLPINFLRQLIGFYGDRLQALVPSYLESSMEAFTHQQEAMRNSLGNTVGGLVPFAQMEEIGRQNMKLIEQALSMMSPFPRREADSHESPSASSAAPANEMQALRDKLAALEHEIDKLAKK